MQLCYIDESGDTGAFTLDNVNSQPVFLLTALFMPQERLASVTRAVIALKQRHFPNLKPEGDHWHDWLRVEVKGAELRRFVREGGKRKRRLAFGSCLRFFPSLNTTIARLSRVFSSRVWARTSTARASMRRQFSGF